MEPYIYFLLLYIFGIFVYIDVDRFLCMLCSTNSYKRFTGKNMRRSLAWPILLILWFVKFCVWVLNELLVFVLLIFDYDYSKSNVYKFIDDRV